MVKLIPIAANPIDIFRSIGADKQNRNGNNRKERILGLDATISTRYSLYSQHFSQNTLEGIPKVAYNSQVKDDLLHCYTSETKSLSKLIRDIKENQVRHIRGICPFCGLNTDSTTDHFLPKDDYPDYCVNSLNLFPCCPDCNSLKGEYLWDNLNNSRGILNFYTDNVNIARFLFATINYSKDVPIINFSLNNVNGIIPSLYTIIELHFNRLNLFERYKERFNSVHHQIKSSFENKPLFHKNPAKVHEFLINDAKKIFDDFGKNSYLGVIREALANSSYFVNQF